MTVSLLLSLKYDAVNTYPHKTFGVLNEKVCVKQIHFWGGSPAGLVVKGVDS